MENCLGWLGYPSLVEGKKVKIKFCSLKVCFWWKDKLPMKLTNEVHTAVTQEMDWDLCAGLIVALNNIFGEWL